MAATAKFGIELELHNLEYRTASNYFSENLDLFRGWNAVSDGSLQPFLGSSVEVVSSPMEIVDLDNGKFFEKIVKLTDFLREKEVGCSDYGSLHVHFDASQFDVKQVNNIIKNYAKNENEIDKFVRISRRRSWNQYARSMTNYATRMENITPAMIQANNMMRYVNQTFDSTRYLKVNPQAIDKHGTLEFRHFHATLDPLQIMNWVKYLRDLIEVSCQSVEGETEIEVPGEQYFVNEVIPGTVTSTEPPVYRNTTSRSNDIVSLFTPTYIHEYGSSPYSEDSIARWFNSSIEAPSNAYKLLISLHSAQCTEAAAGRGYATIEEISNTYRNRVGRRVSDDTIKVYLSQLKSYLETRSQGVLRIKKVRGSDMYALQTNGRTPAQTRRVAMRHPSTFIKLPNMKAMTHVFDGVDPMTAHYLKSHSEKLKSAY